jgi:ubiquinone/menaquinone biosynthesis C-methylase UbiE
MFGDDIKAKARQRFSQYAQDYVKSEVHAAGADLERLLEMVQPQPDWLALDIATGGGHTALKFAPHVSHAIATDLAPQTLQAARTFITQQRMNKIAYTASDAEHLAFAANRFNLITCRIAPHHFPDCFRFVHECTRVLKPGGLLLVEDHVLPEDNRAAR